MKPIYRCDYCDFTDVEEKVQQHELECTKNYNLKGCLTCKYCMSDGLSKVECKLNREIPEGKMYTQCPAHEVGEVEVVGFMKVFGEFLK